MILMGKLEFVITFLFSNLFLKYKEDICHTMRKGIFHIFVAHVPMLENNIL